jgi:predicted short-subunit dehydrogenase-like oxidoreductase (DUF2520 family)
MRELERDKPSDIHSSEPALAIVGPGCVGSSLATAARHAGFTFELAGRDNAPEACARADAVLICVPDDEIDAACEAILSGQRPAFAGHTSGSRGLDALESARRGGIETFTLHPLQTFPTRDTAIEGIPCAVSGSSADSLALARSIAERLGMRPFELDDQQRAAYHAAASIASNFLVTLEEAASELLGRAGVEDARELLAPLVLRTAGNWAEQGGEALTGPIARGDAKTIQRHLRALAELQPELLDSYRALAELTRDLAGHQEGAPA